MTSRPKSRVSSQLEVHLIKVLLLTRVRLIKVLLLTWVVNAKVSVLPREPRMKDLILSWSRNKSLVWLWRDQDRGWSHTALRNTYFETKIKSIEHALIINNNRSDIPQLSFNRLPSGISFWNLRRPHISMILHDFVYNIFLVVIWLMAIDRTFVECEF